MNCASCGGNNQMEFPAEINIHFHGIETLTKPGVFLFPKLFVCLDCGFTHCTLTEDELGLIRESNAA